MIRSGRVGSQAKHNRGRHQHERRGDLFSVFLFSCIKCHCADAHPPLNTIWLLLLHHQVQKTKKVTSQSIGAFVLCIYGRFEATGPGPQAKDSLKSNPSARLSTSCATTACKCSNQLTDKRDVTSSMRGVIWARHNIQRASARHHPYPLFAGD